MHWIWCCPTSTDRIPHHDRLLLRHHHQEALYPARARLSPSEVVLEEGREVVLARAPPPVRRPGPWAPEGSERGGALLLEECPGRALQPEKSGREEKGRRRRLVTGRNERGWGLGFEVTLFYTSLAHGSRSIMNQWPANYGPSTVMGRF